MQANWIGRSEGLLDSLFRSRIDTRRKGESELEVYTTRPDTIFGASFRLIAPDHPLAKAGWQRTIRRCRLRRGMQATGHLGAGTGNRREEGHGHRHPRASTL
jgi:leucyl-tRNA synthetase